jgi:beta-mannanase
MAYIAPLPEMNGDWVPYRQDPANYILAFKRIRNIFSQQNVPAASVRWVFAPNGWSEAGQEFEKYYPGDAYVDVVSFSAYNFGFSTSSQYSTWESPQDVFGPYLARMRSMAHSKPIFIAQTGTTAQYPSMGAYSTSMKNAWLHDAYVYLSNYPGVRAIIYFNMKNSQNIDWPFYPNGLTTYTGYRDGVRAGKFQYIAPSNLLRMTVTP